MSRAPISPPMPLLAACLCLLLVLFQPHWLGDSDTYWHVAVGDWIIAHGWVPSRDPFSGSMAGRPWPAHEWLSELAMALARRTCGWAGVAAEAALCCAAAAWLLARALARELRGPALWLSLLVAASSVAPGLLARPHILALPAMAGWCAGVAAAADRGRVPSWRLLPWMVLWANLHGGFIVGLFFAGVLGAEAVMAAPASARFATARRWAGFGLAAVGAAACNPRGWRGLAFPFELVRLRSLARVAEWQPVALDRIEPIEIATASLLYALARGARPSPARLLALAVLCWQGFAHGRDQMLAGILGALLMAAPLQKAGQGAPADAPAGGARTKWAARAAAGLALAALGLRLARPLPRTDDDMTPVSAVAAVSRLDPALLTEPVLNAYQFGGYLILRGARPYVDSRVELYGDDFLAHYNALLQPNGAALRDWLPRAPVRWTLFPLKAPAVAVLDRLPGWRRVYAGHGVVAHVRTGSGGVPGAVPAGVP